MTKTELLCDLCENPILGRAATLNVPKNWEPKVKAASEDESYRAIFFTLGSTAPSGNEFDVCQGCVEGLMGSRVWLQQVMKGELGK